MTTTDHTELYEAAAHQIEIRAYGTLTNAAKRYVGNIPTTDRDMWLPVPCPDLYGVPLRQVLNTGTWLVRACGEEGAHADVGGIRVRLELGPNDVFSGEAKIQQLA